MKELFRWTPAVDSGLQAEFISDTSLLVAGIIHDASKGGSTKTGLGDPTIKLQLWDAQTGNLIAESTHMPGETINISTPVPSRRELRRQRRRRILRTLVRGAVAYYGPTWVARAPEGRSMLRKEILGIVDALVKPQNPGTPGSAGQPTGPLSSPVTPQSNVPFAHRNHLTFKSDDSLTVYEVRVN